MQERKKKKKKNIERGTKEVLAGHWNPKGKRRDNGRQTVTGSEQEQVGENHNVVSQLNKMVTTKKKKMEKK